MEKFSGAQSTEGMLVDPAAEWEVTGGGTELEEPMWQLGLGGGSESYPERLDAADCMYYLRTGFCGYGNRCRFNHPRDRGAAMRALRASEGDYPERSDQPICQYYMRTGMCKYGASCKYHHPRRGSGYSATTTLLNVYGYPLRPEEKECSYYMQTGHCRFGVTCKFHHPQPAGAQVPAPPGPTHAVYPGMQSPSVQTHQQYGVLQGNWHIARPAMIAGSYVPGNYGPMLLPPGVVPYPGWNPYTGPISPGAGATPSNQPTVGAGQPYGIAQLPPLGAAAYIGPYLTGASAGPSDDSQKENLFPERPGQPECQYYLRTGDCKFGSTCKYHHPPELSATARSFSLNPMGLPLRPGAPLCSHYTQTGICNFGPSCKFDHPMRILSYSPSASSLTDMPVAPYPVGTTHATLAPSSSSSNLRPEFGIDTVSSQMSSMNISSASVGSIFSKTGPAQSTVQSSSSTSSQHTSR